MSGGGRWGSWAGWGWRASWELELGYDEMKTEMLKREETLRSQLPARVLQEMCGIVLAYNLIRLEMERVAEAAGVTPTRISFVAALREIRDEWMWLEATKPGAIPLRLQRLAARLKRFILPERRRERAFPRAVKIKMSKFPRNRRTSLPTGSGAYTNGMGLTPPETTRCRYNVSVHQIG